MTMRSAECGVRNGKAKNSKAAFRIPHSAFRTDVRGVLKLLEGRLKAAGIASAHAEAEWLLADSLGVNRTQLYLWEETLEPQRLEGVFGLLERRIRGEPLQYLLGATWFCGHRLVVSPSVFIPRPETEVLTEQAVQYLTHLSRQRASACLVLDVGTGSANIAISIARAVSTCFVAAVELSWQALEFARANAKAHDVADRVWFIQDDWTCALRGTFDLIVSNPPYVPTAQLQRALAEPRMSLDGGPDGMAFHRRLFDDAPRLLARGGVLGVECAEDQVTVTAGLVTPRPWVKAVEVFQDLAGRPRGLWVERW